MTTAEGRMAEFELDLARLMDRHNIRMLVATYRIGSNQKTVGLSDNDPFNDAAASVIVDMIAAILKDRKPELHAAIANELAERLRRRQMKEST